MSAKWNLFIYVAIVTYKTFHCLCWMIIRVIYYLFEFFKLFVCHSYFLL